MKYHYKILTIVTFLTCICSILFLLYKTSPVKIEMTTSNNPISDSIDPVRTNKFAIQYPEMSIKPTEFPYFSLLLNEYMDLLSNHTPSDITAASRRAEEMRKWGHILTTLHIFDINTVTPDTMFKWWKSSSIIEWGNTSVYGSWEAVLIRYAGNMNAAIYRSDDIYSQLLLTNMILHDRDSVLHVIVDSQKLPDEKKYLTSIAQVIFNSLLSHSRVPIHSFNIKNIMYPLDDIQQSREFGMYSVSLSLPRNLMSYPDLKLWSGNRSYVVSDTLETHSEKYITAVFNNVALTKSESVLILEIPSIAFNLPDDLEVSKIPNVNGTYVYSATAIRPSTSTQYILTNTDVIKEKTIVSLYAEDVNASTGEKKRTSVLEVTTPLYNAARYAPFELSFENKPANGNLLLHISTDRKLTSKKLSSYNLKVLPVLNPVMHLVKQQSFSDKSIVQSSYSYLVPAITLSQFSTHDIQTVISHLPWYWFVVQSSAIDGIVTLYLLYVPLLLSLSLLALTLIIYLNFEFSLISKLQNIALTYSHDTGQLLHKVKRYVNTKRKILLLLMITCIALDFSFPDRRVDIILILIIILWICVLANYKITPDFNFFLSLTLFMPYLMLSIIDIGIAGLLEKIAVYIYVLFVIGLLQSATIILRHSHTLNSVEELETESINVTNKVWRHIKKNIIYVSRLLVVITKRYINTHPKTKRDWYMNIARVCALIAFIFSLVIIEKQITLLIKEELHARQRIKQNPIIKTIEPKLVYKSTKVVIKGLNLGWYSDGQVQLIANGQKVVPELWTDTKIIFTVPQQWKIGTNTLYIEKKISWDETDITAISNPVSLKVLKIDQTFDSDDDLFFEQLKDLDEEVLKLNGYDVKTK